MSTNTNNLEKNIFRKVEFSLVQNNKIHEKVEKSESSLGKKVLLIYTGGLITPEDYNNDSQVLNDIKSYMKLHQTLVDIRATYLIENNDKWIATPVNELGTRVYYTIMELYDNVKKCHYRGYDLWAKIAETIKENYNDFNGFVIIHEISSLDYCSSA